MFLYKKNKSEAEQLMDQMKENSYKYEIARRDRDIHMLELQLAIKDCMLVVKECMDATRELREATRYGEIK